MKQTKEKELDTRCTVGWPLVCADGYVLGYAKVSPLDCPKRCPDGSLLGSPLEDRLLGCSGGWPPPCRPSCSPDSAEIPTKINSKTAQEKSDPAGSSTTLLDSGDKKMSTSASMYASCRQQVDRIIKSTVAAVPNDMEFQTSAQPMHNLCLLRSARIHRFGSISKWLRHERAGFRRGRNQRRACWIRWTRGIGGGMYQQPIEAVMPTRMQLCYVSTSPAGRDLISKCPIPVHYKTTLENVGKHFAHSRLAV